METATLVPIEEYLNTSYRPDCDYVDGEVQERNLGESDHSLVQAALIGAFWSKQKEWAIQVRPEQRVRVSPTRVRIPDVCLLMENPPRERVVSHPPLLCIEILSPRDTLSDTFERMSDYRQLGVPHMWILDPAKRLAYNCTERSLETVASHRLAIEGTPICVDLKEIFSCLD